MENLDLQRQAIDLAARIKSIYDKIDTYTSKRGSKAEAIEIINSDLLFAEEALFAAGENNSFELTLNKVFLEDKQLKGEFKLGLSSNIDSSIRNLMEEYMDFLEIPYQIKLDVQNIEKLIQSISNAIKGFTIASETDYKIDLGEESVVVMSGWEDVYLNTEEKKVYIRGALLKFEDDSEYITRVSKQDDTYILQGNDDSSVKLSIINTRLVLESDFTNITKLANYIHALDTYLLNPYMQKFNIKKEDLESTKGMTKAVTKQVTKDLISIFFGWGINADSENEVEKTIIQTEDIWGESLSSEEIEKTEEQEEGNNRKYTEIDFDTPLDLEFLGLEDKLPIDSIIKSMETKINDKQFISIMTICLKHIKRQISTLELSKNNSDSSQINKFNNKLIKEKLEEINQIYQNILKNNLLEIYKYFDKYFGKDKLNLNYLRGLLKNKIDIYTLGFEPYIVAGNRATVYQDYNDESKHDIGYSPDATYIYTTINTEKRLTYSTKNKTMKLEDVRKQAIRRYSQDGNFIISSSGKAMSKSYGYGIYHIPSGENIDLTFKHEEKSFFTHRATYHLVGDYLIVTGDEKLRVIRPKGDRVFDFAFSIYFENYTISVESLKFFNYSREKLTIYDISSRERDEIDFNQFFGKKVEVLDMHAGQGQIKIIYIQNKELKYVSYEEKCLIDFDEESPDLTSGLISPINEYNITILDDINLFEEIKGAELFFSEDNKYAIFIKKDTIYTIKFTDNGVRLLRTETTGLNHVFRVKFSPDGTEAILRDGNVIYKLDLKLIAGLQIEEEIEDNEKMKMVGNEKNELSEGRKRLVDMLVNIQEMKKKNIVTNHRNEGVLYTSSK